MLRIQPAQHSPKKPLIPHNKADLLQNTDRGVLVDKIANVAAKKLIPLFKKDILAASKKISDLVEIKEGGNDIPPHGSIELELRLQVLAEYYIKHYFSRCFDGLIDSNGFKSLSSADTRAFLKLSDEDAKKVLDQAKQVYIDALHTELSADIYPSVYQSVSKQVALIYQRL